MLAGFLLSRALLSVGTIAFGAIALWGVHPREWLKQKWWLLGVVWVLIYVISGLWSDNMPQYNERVSVKLPVLLLPLGFGLLPAFTDRQLRGLTIGIALMFLGSMFYSLYFLLSDPGYYIEQYRFSKVLPTLGGHDHIRYSLSISLTIIWCIYALFRMKGGRVFRALMWFVIPVLTIYLHVVAVKTGILVLYLFILLAGFYIAFRRKPIIGVGLIAGIFLLFNLGYKYVPTFEQKVDYFNYSWKVFSEGNYSSDYSDIGRLVSYDIALKLIPDYIPVGTGIGDMHDVMREGYGKYYPQVPEFQQLKPHNQFLIVALGCGIPALLIFIVWIFYPLRWVRKNIDGFFLFAIWAVLWIPLMVEPTLELQFGVYVYLFFLLLMAHSMRPVQETVNK